MNKKDHPAIRILLCAAIGILLTGGLVRYFGRSHLFPIVLFAPLLALAAWRDFAVRDRALLIRCGVFAALFAAAVVAGGKIDVHKALYAPFYRSDLLYWAVIAMAAFLGALCVGDWIMSHPILLSKRSRPSPKAVWLFSGILLFICWIPFLYFFYPGNISGDSVACITRAIGKAGLSNQQPVFYILFLRFFCWLAGLFGKSVNVGVALFLCVQAAAMAAMLGYLPSWIAKRGFPRWISIPVLAYFILNPVFPMYAVTAWKDVLFGGLMLVYILNLSDIVQKDSEWLLSARNFIWFLLLNLLLCFMRNNGYYIVFVTLIVLAVLCRRNWKRLVPAFLAVLIVVPVIQGPVYRKCGIAASPFAESVGIPLQQMARTVATNGTMTADQKDFLNHLLPLDEMKKTYKPHTADGVKFNPKFSNAFLEKNKGEFLKVWFQMLGPNFNCYVKAYLAETLGYWHPGTTSWVVWYGVGSGYGAESDGLTTGGISPWNHLTAPVKSFVSAYTNHLSRNLLNIGLLFWAAVFSAMMLFHRGKKREFLSLLPLFLLWLTLMAATPTYCEFRYMFAFATALPLCAILSFPAAEKEHVRKF